MIRNFLSILLAVFTLNAFAAVDANQATRADLESVKGIGPGLSAKIVDARKTGSFKDWSDLVERVGGIGPGNAAKFSQAGLTVGGSAFDASAVAPAPAKEGKKSKKAEKAEKAGKPAA
jgi:competence protein ComEA